jgi:hypothetical protein
MRAKENIARGSAQVFGKNHFILDIFNDYFFHDCPRLHEHPPGGRKVVRFGVSAHRPGML